MFVILQVIDGPFDSLSSLDLRRIISDEKADQIQHHRYRASRTFDYAEVSAGRMLPKRPQEKQTPTSSAYNCDTNYVT